MTDMDMVGNMLVAERKKKGLEIIDAEHATGIRAVYLAALEDGRYATLPGDVYVKGFIRNYGNYLGLDGAHLVQLYTESLQADPLAVTPVTVAEKVESSRKKSSQRQVISTVVIVVLLAISAWSLYAWQKSSPTTPAAVKPEAVAAKSPSSPVAQPPGNTPAVSQPVAAAAGRPITLLARFTDRCWTSVIADGKSIYEGIPKNDEAFTWQADRQIVVNFGNAAAVELTFNGQPVGKIGERGDVVVKTFSLQPVPAVAPAPATTPAPAAPMVKP